MRMSDFVVRDSIVVPLTATGKEGVIREKAEKLNHLFDRLTLIQVTIDLKGVSDGRPPERSVDADRGHGDRGHGKTVEDKCRVEFLVQAEHKHNFVAREKNANLHAAVDLVLDKIEGQLRRYKEKIQDRRRTPSTGEVTGAPAPEGSGEE